MPVQIFAVDAVLFDMDGTLIDSAASVRGAWQTFQKQYPHIDVHDILSSSHGIRTVDNLRNYCKIEDPVQLEIEAQRFEQAIIDSSKSTGQGIVCLPGVQDVMKEISSLRSHPNPLWAICTSATRAYASAALQSAGIPVPDVFVAAEDVTHGKPHPEPYLVGAKQCGVDPANCVVFEDAPNGIRSAKAAGCRTVGFVTTHSRQEMEACGPDFLVPNMANISMRQIGRSIEVTIRSDE